MDSYTNYENFEDIQKYEGLWARQKVRIFADELIRKSEGCEKIYVTPDGSTALMISGDLNYSMDNHDEDPLFAGTLPTGQKVFIHLEDK